MSYLFSIGAWFSLLQKFINAFLPIIPLLLVFSWKKCRESAKLPAFRFFLVFVGLDLAIRLLIYFAGVPYQGRYLHMLIIAACVLAGTGIFPLSEFVSEKILKRRFPAASILTILFVAVLLVHAGKALSPPDPKPWLDSIPEMIKKHCPPDKKPILISEDRDIRISYYAGAEDLRLDRKDSVNYFTDAIICLNGVESPILNDEKEGESIVLSGNSSFKAVLMKGYPYRIGTFVLKGKGLENARIAVQRKDARNPFKIIEEDSSGRYCAKFLCSPGNEFNFTVELPQDQTALVSEIELVQNNAWKILRFGEGVSQGYKFPAVPPRSAPHFQKSISELGTDNVFMLVKGSREEFENLLARHNCVLQMSFLGSSKDSSKETISLFQGVK